MVDYEITPFYLIRALVVSTECHAAMRLQNSCNIMEFFYCYFNSCLFLRCATSCAQFLPQ